mmetsp:Transcript_23512/g.37445  ORF Transcript_23512/g.37445 Transcript_23512/m.37445 type:complete len:103 (-) Transcript_23512:298-606(-)
MKMIHVSSLHIWLIQRLLCVEDAPAISSAYGHKAGILQSDLVWLVVFQKRQVMLYPMFLFACSHTEATLFAAQGMALIWLTTVFFMPAEAYLTVSGATIQER